MSEATRWWWIRHAPVTAYGDRIYGQTDVPANTSDVEAIAALAAILPSGAQWVTSNLKRTTQTADALAAAASETISPAVEADLAEQNFGAWQGKNRAKIIAQHADWRSFWLAPADHAPPGGESFVQVMARVAAAIDRLSRAHAGRDIVAVAHGGSIKAALGHALGLDPEEAVAFTIDNLSLTRLERINGTAGAVAWRVGAVNQAPGQGAA